VRSRRSRCDLELRASVRVFQLAFGVGVSYVDAGYAVALGTLALYAGWLWQRRARLEKLVEREKERPDQGELRVESDR